jgi:hypothetical protein
MRNTLYVALCCAICFIQCGKTKLEPLPEYKSTNGTKLDSNYLHFAGLSFDKDYTYLLDDRYDYHLFFRIRESDGMMEAVPQFNTLASFAVSDQYIYTARRNQYPLAFYTFCRVNKADYKDSVIINTRMVYSYLTCVDGIIYGIDQVGSLNTIDPATGNGTELISGAQAQTSQVSFYAYLNASKFYNGWWLFTNKDDEYLLKVKTDGSKEKDTIQSVKMPVFAIYSNRIYFAQANPDLLTTNTAVSYRYCLASVSFDGGPVTIEDTTHFRYCNTVSNYGNLLMIGDGRFIKTFDPITREVKVIGAMPVLASDAGTTLAAYPVSNPITGSIYYSAYYERFPVYKIK